MSFVYPSLQRVPDTVGISGTNALSDSSGGAAVVAAASATPMKADSVVSTPRNSANDLADAAKHFSTTSEPKGRQQFRAADGADGAPKILHGLNYGRELEAAAKKHGIDPILLAAVAAQESGGGGIQAHNIDQRNGLGRGPMQIDIGAWPEKASIAHDPAKSTDFAAFLLRDGFNQADRVGDAKTSTEKTKEALRVYNGSSPHAKTTTTQWPDGRIPYEESVLRHYAQIKIFLASPASH